MRFKLFPFKLVNYEIPNPIWCNYWLATPAVFDSFCTKYLSKALALLRDSELYDLTESHRNKEYIATTFFLEGLFSLFVEEEKNIIKK